MLTRQNENEMHFVVNTHHRLAGGRSDFSDGLDDGLGGSDFSDDDDLHGYFFSAHFSVFGWCFGKSEMKTKYLKKIKKC